MGAFQNDGFILRRIGDGLQDLWEASTSYLNTLGWQLSWDKKEDDWFLYSWNRPIFITYQWLLIQSFVYGMVNSAIDILFRSEHPPSRRLKQEQGTNISTGAFDNFTMIEVFNELVTLNEQIFKYEMRFATPGRAISMYYNAYRPQQYAPQYAQDYEQFGAIYERKLDLEAKLKSLCTPGIDRLKSAARNLELIPIVPQELLPTAIAFLFFHLWNLNSSWYPIKGKWYLFHGDILVFSAENKEDFEAFMLGNAYSFANLSDDLVDKIIRDV